LQIDAGLDETRSLHLQRHETEHALLKITTFTGSFICVSVIRSPSAWQIRHHPTSRRPAALLRGLNADRMRHRIGHRAWTQEPTRRRRPFIFR